MKKRCPNCGREYGDEANFCTRDGTRLVVPTPATADLVGLVLDDRYEIQRKLGEGGMGLVYLATDKTTEEIVAIKLLTRGLGRDPKALGAAAARGGLGMRLAHPNVCHIIRMGETEDGLVYVVMPFVEGEILVRPQQPAGATARLTKWRSSSPTWRRDSTWRTSSRSCIAISSPRTS